MAANQENVPPVGADDCGTIAPDICSAILDKELRLLAGFEGSEESSIALDFATRVAQVVRSAQLEVVHVEEDNQKDLPLPYRRERIEATLDAKLIETGLSKRTVKRFVRRHGDEVGDLLCERIASFGADFAFIGVVGWKGRKASNIFTSSIFELLRQGKCSVVCFQSPDQSSLSSGRPTKFVVSANLHKASSKAFLDALRLSKPGDVIHAVYIKSSMERTESDYTRDVRQTYESFLESIKCSDQKIFAQFQDRRWELVVISKQKRESTPQAIARYADEIDADFIVVGTNANRVERGKTAVGSVSMQICMETDRNFIVANWLDLKPELYHKHVVRQGTNALCT
jgi:nucleotide-binding universal stress UspA family protein